MQDTLRIGRAAINHVRTKGPAILQVHTFRFNGHSPADPEHERNRKDEKRWARAECDPIKIFEESEDATRVDAKVRDRGREVTPSRTRGAIKAGPRDEADFHFSIFPFFHFFSS